MSSTDSYAYSSDNNDTDTEQYIDLIGFDKYEILTTEPFTIRRKDNKRVVTETLMRNGYIKVGLNTQSGQVNRYKHRLIAQQFIPNPDNLPEVDHIDRNRQNNTLSNLRWVSRSENCRNRTVKPSGKHQFINHAPNDITEIISFNDIIYPNNTYYFCYEDDCIYKKHNDHKWLKMKQTPHCGYLVIKLTDINHNRHEILMPSLIKHFRTQPAEQVAEQDDE